MGHGVEGCQPWEGVLRARHRACLSFSGRRPGPHRQHPRRPRLAHILPPPIRRGWQPCHPLPPQRRLAGELPPLLLPGRIGVEGEDQRAPAQHAAQPSAWSGGEVPGARSIASSHCVQRGNMPRGLAPLGGGSSTVGRRRSRASRRRMTRAFSSTRACVTVTASAMASGTQRRPRAVPRRAISVTTIAKLVVVAVSPSISASICAHDPRGEIAHGHLHHGGRVLLGIAIQPADQGRPLLTRHGLGRDGQRPVASSPFLRLSHAAQGVRPPLRHGWTCGASSQWPADPYARVPEVLPPGSGGEV